MCKELPSGTLGEVLTNDAAIVEKWSPESLGEPIFWWATHPKTNRPAPTYVPVTQIRHHMFQPSSRGVWQWT